jgi:colanic acid biosynthesis protein WcaH
MNWILPEKYAEYIEALPILCVDMVIQNSHQEYLLIRRINEPKKGQWWPVGGRVLKGESLEQAAIRKIKQETGLSVNAVSPIGYFETVADANPFGLPFKYHAVSVVFETVIDEQQQIRLDEQSTEWKFASELPADFSFKPFVESVLMRDYGKPKYSSGERIDR